MKSFGQQKTVKSNGIPPASIKEFILWAIGRRNRFRVKGISMIPLLKDGDHIFLRPTKDVKIGEFVIAHDPMRDLTVVKKVIDTNGLRYVLRGVNRASAVTVAQKTDIIGRVTSSI